MPDEKGGYYDRLQREQTALNSIRSDLNLAKRRLAEMRKQLEGETPLLDSSSYGSAQILKLRSYREQLEQLLTQYTEGHPDVQALRAAIADVMADDGAETDEIMDIGTGDSVEFNPVYQELKAEIHKASVEVETMRIKLLEKEKTVEALKQSVDIIPVVEAELAKLNRDYEITRERHLELVERREEARMAQEVGQSGSNINFRIIDPPRVPLKSSGPNRYLLLTAVLLVAISAGLGWGFLRYLLQPAFIDSSQITERTGLPVLGSVGLYLTNVHKSKRKLQLTSFLLVFLLLTGLYGGVMLYSETGSQLVGEALSAKGKII
jgi:polysaccharide chain length determinant protein (PEP-CTERM system associated)